MVTTQLDYLSLIHRFFAERCDAYPSYRQPVQELGRDWHSWLLFQRVSWAQRRAWRPQVFLATLFSPVEQGGLGLTFVQRDGRKQLMGFRLKPLRPAYPTGFTWQTLQEATAGEDAAKRIPLTGATAGVRPSSQEIVRRFLEQCCVSVAQPEHQEGVPMVRQMEQWAHEPLTRLHDALVVWLRAQSVRPSLLSFCTAKWLRRELVYAGKIVRLDLSGILCVYGVQLAPAYQDADRWRRPGLPSSSADTTGAAPVVSKAESDHVRDDDSLFGGNPLAPDRLRDAFTLRHRFSKTKKGRAAFAELRERAETKQATGEHLTPEEWNSLANV